MAVALLHHPEQRGGKSSGATGVSSATFESEVLMTWTLARRFLEVEHGSSPNKLRFSARPTSGIEGTNPPIYNKPQSSSYSNMYLS